MTTGPAPGTPARPYRVPRGLADPIVEVLGGWLEGEDATAAAAIDRPPDALPGLALRRLITVHGLGPFLVRDPIAAAAVAASVAASAVPADVPGWLELEDERNRLRIERLLEELAAALRAFAAAGLPVMPLKGAILATRPGADPFRRPMADLDLLVRPGDRDAARATLTSLGYRRRPERNRRPTHDTFELPGNDRAVAVDGEHPDNPRRIELHTEVRRHLWTWVDDDDLTRFLWAGALEGTVLGEPAVLPLAPALGAHLAIHATSDLLMARGRLIQWLDLAEVTGGFPDAAGRAAGVGPAVRAPATDHVDSLELATVPHPRLVYPALRLAARRLAGRLPPTSMPGLATLEARVPVRLVRWAERVPLDTRAGLGAGRYAPGDVSTLGARWTRWAPYAWRLAVAHGDVPRPVAALRHAARVASMARRRP
ncbi:MAG TPA: nucleotidyltransferase family protein [Candidatus Limnocylindrales bacterium]|nr:nucleotidyltransferase family protein [Candidatus Limnocylindrales bacterium]